MRFFDKSAKAEAQTEAIAKGMTEKLAAKGYTPAKELVSSWRNEAASYQTSGGGSAPSTSGWASDLAYEQPEILDRPTHGRRSVQVDAAPVQDRSWLPPRNTYRPERLFDTRGVFGAMRSNGDGRRDEARWPMETRTYIPRPGGGCTCGSPGCTG